MKLFDFVIYICLILFGVSVGWYLRGPKINQTNIEFQKQNKSEVQKPKKAPRQNEYTAAPKPELPYNNESTPKVDLPKVEMPIEKPIVIKQSETVDPQQFKILETQKCLLKNDFQGAISVMISCKDIVGEEFALLEISNLIANYMQSKLVSKEQMIVLPEIEKALASNPGWWPLIILKGKVFIALGEFEEGAKSLSKEMFYLVKEKELNELVALIRFLRGKRIEQLKQQKLFHRLIEYYEELIVVDSAFALYYYELGKLYAEKFDYDSALVILKIIILDETYGKDAEAIISQIEIAKELEANRLAIKLDDRNAIEIPIVRINDRIFIDIVLNGKTSSKFLVDTGATISVISFTLAARLGFNSNQLTDMRWFQTAGGRVRKPVVKLSQISVGDVRMQNFLVAVSKDVGKDLDGILGMNFLGRFNFEINSDRSVLILTSK